MRTLRIQARTRCNIEDCAAPEGARSKVKNGELLRRLSDACAAFATLDKNLPREQPLSGLTFGVIIVRVRPNRLEGVLPLVPDILAALPNLGAGDVVTVGSKSPMNHHPP